MSEEVETADAVATASGWRRALEWLLLTGNRAVITVGLVLGVFLVLYGLAATGLIAVGPTSAVSTIFGSGLTSGLLTLVTVALSINQLILSRVFGSPNDLEDRLSGTRELRSRVEALADRPASPIDPAAFLELVAETLGTRARRLDEAASLDDAAFERYVAGVVGYADSVEENIQSHSSIVDVLEVILGTEYARNMTATDEVQSRYGDRLSEAATDELSAVSELFESIAVTRQFFKTLSLQQDFAKLSRVVAVAGLGAFLTVVALTLVYRPQATPTTTTVDPAFLPVLATAGVAVVASPLAALIAYLLRAATIARRTVSVGPFVPPEERPDS